jgi:hypothetical protein
VSDPRCGKCGAEVPFLLSEAAQQPARENRSRRSGVEIYVVSLQPTLLETWYPVHDGPCFGFKVIDFSSQPTQVDLALGKPTRDGAAGIVDGTLLGAGYRSLGTIPTETGVWFRKTGSTENRTITVAVFTEPGDFGSINPVVIAGLAGMAGVQDADADADFDAAILGLEVNSRNALFNGSSWTRQQQRNADADGDFDDAIEGVVANVRTAFMRGSNSEWTIWMGDLLTGITGEGHALRVWPRAAAALFGRDTSDSTVRAIEARVSATIAALTETGLYRLLTDARVRGLRASSGSTSLPVTAEIGSTAAGGTGIGDTTFYGLASFAALTKYDLLNTDYAPVHYERSVQTTSATAAVGAVLATLDCRSQVFKDCHVISTEVSTVDVQVSHDGTTWQTIVLAFATAAGTVFPLSTALLLQRVQAYRHLRILAGAAGFAAPVTGVISAQGG